METFWYAFIPLFVAFDGVGLLPMFWSLVHRLGPAERRLAVTEAVFTAFFVALAFLLVSRFIFGLMGLELVDVMVAGGAILIVLCLRELLVPDSPRQARSANPGVVPLGVPLLTGPAVLTTIVLVRHQHGWPMTLLALFVNLVLVWAMLRGSNWLMPRLGREGSQVISKIANLVLTAFGVMLIRQGLLTLARPLPLSP